MADTGVVDLLLKRIEVVDGGVDSQDVAKILSVDHQVVVGAVKSLQSLGDVRYNLSVLVLSTSGSSHLHLELAIHMFA